MSKSISTITVSIVSHLQANLVKLLLTDLDKYCKTYPLKVELTLNLPEKLDFNLSDYSFPIAVHINHVPLGFAANHNKAFLKCTEPFFCVMNPDVRINEDPFNALIGCLQDLTIGVVAPMVISENGVIEDSARLFPTPLKILCKVFGGGKAGDYEIRNVPIYPDWVGGMFMLFRQEIFAKLNGFDERFFLYYEDVDLCARLRLLGYGVVMCPSTQVIHVARRSSHSSFKYLKWHLASMLRFFCSAVFFQVFWQKFIRVNIK